eukprot:scaffold38856_cov60-Phaeocystis_antarctica.AAC.5
MGATSKWPSGRSNSWATQAFRASKRRIRSELTANLRRSPGKMTKAAGVGSSGSSVAAVEERMISNVQRQARSCNVGPSSPIARGAHGCPGGGAADDSHRGAIVDAGATLSHASGPVYGPAA